MFNLTDNYVLSNCTGVSEDACDERFLGQMLFLVGPVVAIGALMAAAVVCKKVKHACVKKVPPNTGAVQSPVRNALQEKLLPDQQPEGELGQRV